jgi:hypothetical protein
MVMQAISDPSILTDLIPLLDEPLPAKWLAFQLLELVAVADDISQRCLKIIKSLAENRSGGAETMGIRIWLREYEAARVAKAPDSPMILDMSANTVRNSQR